MFHIECIILLICCLIFLLIMTVIWLIYYMDYIKPKNFPFGPKWYPIFGSAIKIYKLRKKYGMLCNVIDKLIKFYPNNNGLIGLKIGQDNLVIAYTANSIREMMLNEDLDGRPNGIFYKSRTFGKRMGLIVTDGEFWQEQRRFIIRHLKEFGFARRGMIDNIQNELQYLISDIRQLIIDNEKNLNNENNEHDHTHSTSSNHYDNNNLNSNYAIIQMRDFFGTYILNTLWKMLAGKRYNNNNCELNELQMIFFELLKNVDMIGSIFSHFPILCYLAPNLSGYTKFINIHKKFYDFLQNEINLHKLNLHLNDEPNDLIDIYLNELKKSNMRTSSFSEQQLLALCLDLFLAGTETTNKSLGFAFLHMIRNKKIQEKAQNEIDTFIGRERLPTWDDRVNLPYCEAIVHEALRFFMGNSFGVPHRALKDTELCGFNIPKNTTVIGCFRGMLMHDSIYNEPTKFLPERFINNDGTLQVPNSFAPFGLGRHRCMGEILGRQNLFLFITTLLQNYKFLPLNEQQLPDDEPLDGVTPSVKPFTAIVVPR